MSASGHTTLVTSDLDAAFDKIGELHDEASLTVTYNSAGEDALSEAMECIFDADWATLSSLWLNENDSTLAVRPHTLAEIDSSGTVMATMTLGGVEVHSGTPYIVFNSGGSTGCESAALEVVASANDKKVDLDPPVRKNVMFCDGNLNCDAIAAPDPDGNNCSRKVTVTGELKCECNKDPAGEPVPGALCISIFKNIVLDATDAGVTVLY